MTNSKIHLIEQKVNLFPPLPTAVARVIKVTNDPESSANDLMRAVVSDQSICTTILQIANSALFGRPKQVKSLQDAIMVLGFNEVKSFVLGTAVVSSFKETAKRHDRAVSRFWDHAFTTGLAAKIIGEQLNRPSGQYFIAGLLHDIGKLAMLLTFDDEYSPETWMTVFSNDEQLKNEKHTFGVSHDHVGSHLLRKWNFPDEILSITMFHHAPLGETEFASFAQIVQLADVISHLCCDLTIRDDEVIEAITDYLPGVKERWINLELPWDHALIESWYTLTKIDREYGSSIMTVMSP